MSAAAGVSHRRARARMSLALPPSLRLLPGAPLLVSDGLPFGFCHRTDVLAFFLVSCNCSSSSRVSLLFSLFFSGFLLRLANFAPPSSFVHRARRPQRSGQFRFHLQGGAALLQRAACAEPPRTALIRHRLAQHPTAGEHTRHAGADTPWCAGIADVANRWPLSATPYLLDTSARPSRDPRRACGHCGRISLAKLVVSMSWKRLAGKH